MGRWRPPQPPGSPYITPQGAAALKQELRYLWWELRPEVVKAVTAAAAEGDRSENAEYIYRKKQLREIDGRVRYLTKRIEVMKIVNQVPSDTSIIRFGAKMTLQDGDQTIVHYRIVGVDETDSKAGCISIDSPVAKALLGKTIGDSIEVDLPESRVRLTVLAIEYQAPVKACSNCAAGMNGASCWRARMLVLHRFWICAKHPATRTTRREIRTLKWGDDAAGSGAPVQPNEAGGRVATVGAGIGQGSGVAGLGSSPRRKTPMRNRRNLLFDFDGTLVDSP